MLVFKHKTLEGMRFLKRKAIIITLVSTLVLGSSSAFAEQSSGSFSDVPTSHWAAAAIEWGVQNKIVSGYGNGTFKPNSNVTEAEFLSMLINTFDKPEKPAAAEMKSWKDFEAQWAIPVYNRANDLKYTRIAMRSTPDTKINRLYVAELLTSAQGLNFEGDLAIKYVLGKGIVSGKGGEPSIDGYDAISNLTRAEAIQIIKNLKDKGVTQLKERPDDPSPMSVLENLPVDVKGKTMFEKIQGTIENANYEVINAPNGSGTIMIIDKSKPMKLPGLDTIAYKSVAHFQDMRLEKDRVAIITGAWSGLEPTKDTYEYVEKLLKLVSVPDTDKIIKGIQARYNDGKFNQHGQIDYDQKVGSFNLGFLLSSSGTYGFEIFVDKQ